MFKKEKFLKLSKTLFILLVILIPVNLGKHFISNDSYILGLLVDYLQPVIYVQDILSISIILFWFIGGGIEKIFIDRHKVLERREVQFIILFLFSTFLSALSSHRFLPSIYFWSRLFIQILILLYILSEIKVEEYYFRILDIISVTTFLIGIIGVLQYINHGSIFNNYLMFGEQPYSYSTQDISKKIFLGKNVIPSYSIFRHPNIFGGYLSLVLVWIYSFLKRNKLYLVSFVVGVFALFFTFSYLAWLVFLFGIFLQTFFSKSTKNIKEKKSLISIVVVLLCLFLSIFPVFSKFKSSTVFENPTFYRRINLLEASYKMIKDYPIFGVGINNFTVFVEDYVTDSRDIRFTQPVHNIFLLILSECGVFSFLFFLLFLKETLKKLLNSSYFHVLLVSFLQLILLSSLDHYIFTIHQTQFLFWIIIGMSLQ